MTIKEVNQTISATRNTTLSKSRTLNNISRPYKYVKIQGVILARKDKYQISLDTISVIEDFNEITNHFLHVVLAKCARKYGVEAIESSSKPAGEDIKSKSVGKPHI